MVLLLLIGKRLAKMSGLKRNIGVYTDPDHNLYIADAAPHHEDVTDPSKLKHGEVVIRIRSTGICGLV